MVQLPSTSFLNKRSNRSFKLKPLILCLPVISLGIANHACALDLDITQHWVRDYLDFGQNKGIFKPGATGLVLERKDGTTLQLPNVPFPDFRPVSNHGSVTSIGGAYMITAQHNKKDGTWQTYAGNPEWGKTKYALKDSMYHDDFAVARLNKFVVETEGVTSGIDRTLTDAEALERYGVEYNGKKQILVYRAGAGFLELRDANGKTTYNDVGYKPELVGGSIYTMDWWNQGGDRANTKNFLSFSNLVTGGDSGSSALVWDNQAKQWVVLGVLWGAIYSTPQLNVYSKWHQATVDALKAKYTHKVELNGKTLTFVSDKTNEYAIEGNNTTFGTDKDLSFTGGGTVTLSQNLNLGIGGLIFDEGKKYTVNGDNLSYKGAGVDIGKDTVVEWNIKGESGDNLHKIGQGTLEVNVAQGNNLKIGNGTTVLNADKTFNGIYMASGAGTIKLGHANALNKNDNKNGIFFASGGGTLDINGFSQTFQRIAASDSGAIVTNTSTQRADLSFVLPWQYAYHGQFTGNLNVRHEFDAKPTDEAQWKNRHLVLDGGMKIDGELSVKNAKLTLQGMPENHAIFREKPCTLPPFLCGTDWKQQIQNKENEINQQLGTQYKDNNQVSAFVQPDWVTRKYQFDTLKLENAIVDVGRNTHVIGNIVAEGSTMQFGGEVKLYRDEFAGNNVTGFDFQQKLHEGHSVDNSTIYFEGDIEASKSSFVSYMPILSASFDLKDGSTFESKADSSITRLRDKGISVTGGSSLMLGDILVMDNKNPVTVSKSEDSTLSIQNVEVQKAELFLPKEVVHGALRAYEGGFIHVDDWTLDQGNLQTQKDGRIHLKHLTSMGNQVANANLTIEESLKMGDLNPNVLGSSASAWVGLSVQGLTFKPNAKVSAAFSNDFLSLNNMTFDTEYTLVSSTNLVDERTEKNVEFDLGGLDVVVNSAVKNDKIVFEFTENKPAPEPDPQPGPQPNPQPNPDPSPDLDVRPHSELIIEKFQHTTQNPKANAILNAIQSHNASGGWAYQEVALKDALSMSNVDSGAEALSAIVERTDRMLASTARTITQDRMIQPIRTAIDSRLTSLRTSKRQTAVSDYPVAAVGDLSAIGRAMDDDARHQSVFVDVSGGLQKDDGRKDRIISTNFGYDKVFRMDGARVVLGGAFSVSEINNQNDEATDDGRMYSLTGYFSREQPQGVEYQSYLTVGQLSNERSFVPEISLGRQVFDEKSWSVMSSNYLKYRFNMGQFSVKPMLLADLGWTRIEGSESTYLKREDLSDTSLDLGLGIELDGYTETAGWLVQMTARRNVWNSADSVGVNLKNAQGFISYDLHDRKETIFGLNGMISQSLTPMMNLDLATGATASTSGAIGINGNVRLRWHF